MRLPAFYRYLVFAGCLTLLLGACDLFPKRSPGEKLYRKRCAKCHGIDARGNTPEYMGNAWADLTDDDWKNGGEDGDISYIIEHGIFAKMPANDDLTKEQVKQIVGYLHKLREKANAD